MDAPSNILGEPLKQISSLIVTVGLIVLGGILAFIGIKKMMREVDNDEIPILSMVLYVAAAALVYIFLCLQILKWVNTPSI